MSNISCLEWLLATAVLSNGSNRSPRQFIPCWLRTTGRNATLDGHIGHCLVVEEQRGNLFVVFESTPTNSQQRIRFSVSQRDSREETV